MLKESSVVLRFKMIWAIWALGLFQYVSMVPMDFKRSSSGTAPKGEKAGARHQRGGPLRDLPRNHEPLQIGEGMGPFGVNVA